MLLGPFRRKGRAGKMLIICIIASLIEIGTMVFLHTVKYADLMIFLSYGLVLGAISICLLLLTPWGYDRINLSWIWREG